MNLNYFEFFNNIFVFMICNVLELSKYIFLLGGFI